MTQPLLRRAAHAAPGMALLIAPAAWAQEAMYTEAATMPSKGTVVLREQLHCYRFGLNPINGDQRTDKVELSSLANIGLGSGWALSAEVPVQHETTEDSGGDREAHVGVDDIHLMLKWRVYKHDSGGIDTLRAALLGGADVTSGDNSRFASQSVNPFLGGVITIVRGRHGFNQDVIYQFNTGGQEESNLGGEGPADALRFNTAYLYRTYPDAYTQETTGAWYVTAEVNGLYETNGDIELRFAPGLMFEGRTFGFEVMGQLPMWHELRHRPELDFGVGVGVRFFF